MRINVELTCDQELKLCLEVQNYEIVSHSSFVGVHEVEVAI